MIDLHTRRRKRAVINPIREKTVGGMSDVFSLRWQRFRLRAVA